MPSSSREKIIAIVALIITAFMLLYVASDFADLQSTPLRAGWDFMAGCEAARIFDSGLNPYLIDNYHFNPNPYTYAPVFVPVTSLMCKGLFIHKLEKVYIYFPVYLGFLGLVLVSAIRVIKTQKIWPLLVVAITVGFGGVAWVLRTGNYALAEALFLISALAFLMRWLGEHRKPYDVYVFAILFGLFCCIKTVATCFILLFVFLPFSKKEKISAAVIAALVGLMPVLLSYLLMPENIPYQWQNIARDQSLCRNPSFYWLANEIRLRIVHQTLPVGIWMVSQAVLSLAALVYCLRRGLWDAIRAPEAMIRAEVFLVALYWAELSLPRLKEYSYVLLAIIMAYYLLMRRRQDAMTLVILLTSAVPVLVNQPRVNGDNPFGVFVQLIAAATVGGLMLYDTMTRAKNEIRPLPDTR